MGCCGSKEDHEQDANSEPLLGNQHTRRNSQPRCPSYDTFDIKMEQDFWNDVIERTTRPIHFRDRIFKKELASTAGWLTRLRLASRHLVNQ
ncbi:hypothetical protein CLU79DRAFT_170082 [Phycomyces nitens]|nr:hypothetical protein CLU79DRAFT_170082 [Phycomyces nitens]